MNESTLYDEDLMEQLRSKIAAFPRVSLADLPTPLHEAPRLSKALGGPQVLFKRDDLTGLAFGGNKTRMLEFDLAEALKRGADTIVAGSVVQSNYLRQLAAACSRLGLEAHFVLSKVRGDKDLRVQGNLFLDLLLGAHVKIVEEDFLTQRETKVREALADELRAKGRKVYIPWWDTAYLNSMGYVNCALEILEQLNGLGIRPNYLYVASANANQAGLVVGFRYLKANISVVGFNPEHWYPDTRPEIARYANEAAKHLGIDVEFSPDDIVNTNDYIGERYGAPTKEGLEAIKLVARTEGILLDPVYTGKAMAGLVDHVRRGKLGTDDTVIFLHTGGNPALFAYHEDFGNLTENLAK
ncbi:MAG: D-cysteine desulfhydrase family protein [Anaerolineae bacterium]